MNNWIVVSAWMGIFESVKVLFIGALVTCDLYCTWLTRDMFMINTYHYWQCRTHPIFCWAGLLELERIWCGKSCFASSPVVSFSTCSFLIASLEKSDHRVEGGILLSNFRVAKSEMWVLCHRKLPWSCSSSNLDAVPSILCTWSWSNIVWLIASADGLRVFSTCFFFCWTMSHHSALHPPSAKVRHLGATIVTILIHVYMECLTRFIKFISFY